MNYWKLTPSPTHGENSSIGQDRLCSLRNLSVTALLNLHTKSGIHLVFMPSFQEELYRYDQDFSNRLMKEFFLPKFFFEHMGWDANGFFGCFEVPLHNHSDRGQRGFGTFCRFLSKRIVGGDHGTNTSKYTWHYMGISTLWLKHSDEHERKVEPGISLPSNETHIMLCFDLHTEMIKKLISAFDQSDLLSSPNEPFFQLKVALGAVVEQFEEDLNTFQPAVRKIEKERYDVISKTDSSDISPELDKERRGEVVERYTTLHEVSRHVLHIAETLGAATNNLASIIQEHELWGRALQSSLHSLPNNTARTMRLYLNIVSNLKLRADAFVARMENEIKCASNLLGVVNNNISQQTLVIFRKELKNVQFELMKSKEAKTMGTWKR